MAQQIIDTGAAANDGTGEPLRDAFTAVNENFTEIYTAGPVGSNVVISGNTITVTGVNNNLVLRANGIGNIQANSTIMPSIDAVYDIGAPTQRVDTVYAQYFVGNGSGITGVTAAAASNISLGFSNVTVTAGGPVTIGIQNTGNTAVFGAANTTFKGNLLPASNVTYDLGSVTQAWNDLYLSGNTVYLNNATITSDATALTFTNQAGGTFVLAGTGQSGSNTISNGSSNVNIASAAGPVTIGIAGVTRGTFNANGLQVTGYLDKAHGIEYSKFYDDLYQWIQKDDWFREQFAETRDYFANWTRHGSINHPPIGNIQVFGWNLVHRTTLYMQQQDRVAYVFDSVDRFVKSHYNIDKDILDQLMQFQRNYVIDYRDLKSLPIKQQFDYDFLGYILDNEPIKQQCTYMFDTVEDQDMSMDRFLENMYFARKRNFGKTTITRDSIHNVELARA